MEIRASQVAQNLPAKQETWVQVLGQENPARKEMATCSSIFAWEIPWTEETDGSNFMGLQRVRWDIVTTNNKKKMITRVGLPPVWAALRTHDDEKMNSNLSNSMKPSHAHRATQDGCVMVERSDRMWSLEKEMANHFSILALRTP